MAKEKNTGECKQRVKINDQGSNMVYCLGIIGAAIYYIGQADTFWQGVLGFLKALVWPAFLIYQALEKLS